jgi:hypothetical protein
MKTINGGSAVPGGYYLSKTNWEFFPIEKDGQKLPGPASEHYVKLPMAAVFLVMPVLGGLMVVFLPFIGLAMTAHAAVRPLANVFRKSAEDLAATVTPGWAPGAAHFTGQRPAEKGEGEKAAGEEPAADCMIDELASEIESKRKS